MRLKRIVFALAILIILGILIYQIPAVQNRLAWGFIQSEAYVRGVLNPAGAVPTPLPTEPPAASATPTQQLPTSTTAPEKAETATTIPPTPSPTALPANVYLDPPAWEVQEINGCGPATLSMYLSYYGWEGNQHSIDEVIKPERADRNVNVEELAYYAWNNAGWLSLIYRVNGTVEMLKTFIANGIPVMIEEGDELAQQYWPDDDMWAGHFLLITGYDDVEGVFIAQDSFRQADLKVPYEDTDRRWKYFNRVFILVYQAYQEETVQTILGEDWDADVNRQNALDTAQAEIDANPEDSLAWFNLGSNLVYFERYQEAVDAYNQARVLGLPQRMLRYQFGPFHAYFHTQQYDELLALTEYALEVTPNSEEALLWKGWALYNLGDNQGAIKAFRASYQENYTSFDAKYALDFMGVTP